MNIIKGAQEIVVKVSTTECFNVVNNNLKDIQYDEIITMLWVKFKQENNISKEWFAHKDDNNILYWIEEVGYDHYAHDKTVRELSESELEFYNIITDLTNKIIK